MEAPRTAHSQAKTACHYKLKDELVQAEDTDLSNGNTLLDRATWGLDAAENWLSDTRAATSLMETAANDSFKAQDTRPRSHRGRRPDRR